MSHPTPAQGTVVGVGEYRAVRYFSIHSCSLSGEWLIGTPFGRSLKLYTLGPLCKAIGLEASRAKLGAARRHFAWTVNLIGSILFDFVVTES